MWKWFSPKQAMKDAKNTVWSSERSSLVAIYRAMQANPEVSQRGIPPGQEEAFLRAARRGHAFWLFMLFGLLAFAAFKNMVLGATFFGNLVVSAMLLLAVVETMKHAFFIWHHDTGEGFQAFLRLLLKKPSLVLRPRRTP